MGLSQLVVAGVELAIAFFGAAALRQRRYWTLANWLVLGVAIAAMYTGPIVFRDWFHEGFIAGFFLGSFLDLWDGQAEADAKAANSRCKELQRELDRLRNELI